MEKDIRNTDLYREIEALCNSLRQPGTGQISDAAEVHASPDGRHVVFAGTIMDELNATEPTRICLTELASGKTQVLTFGPNADRSPKFSPDGQKIAFLSDRRRAGNLQLYLLDCASGAAYPTPPVSGWVEYLHWSPDGTRILLGVAGHGADVASIQGAIPSRQVDEGTPSWMPIVQTNEESHRWRSAWVYEVETRCVRQVSHADANIWEAVWCGNDLLVTVTSAGPGEGLWYSARLTLIDVNMGDGVELYKPRYQLGWPSACPAGKQVAIVEALCSDRRVVAGDLLLIDVASGKAKRVGTQGVDISYAEWRSSRNLLLAGHRGFETVVGLYDAEVDAFTEVWTSGDLTIGGTYATVAGINDAGDCALVGEGFTRAPEIAVIRGGRYESVRSFDLGYCDQVNVIQATEQVSWSAPDGLVIQGWLLRPEGKAPHPLILYVHGGPVGHSRPVWLGRRAGAPVLFLVRQGYAVFFPNPRGSSGRGQEFSRYVCGDIGGAETADHLSGLDHLILQGLADPARLGVMGVSHGGFMTAWLITQDRRFAAAVAVAPITNFVTEYLMSSIAGFVSLFVQDEFHHPGGQYFRRSPVMHAHKAQTPTLNVCGGLDRSTPPQESLQFHQALLENGTPSVLITYPEEGHGIRKYPAAIDYVARVVTWFEKHMPARQIDAPDPSNSVTS